MIYKKNKTLLALMVSFIIFVVVDLLLAQSIIFRYKIQKLLWNPSDEIISILSNLNMEPYTVVRNDVSESSSFLLEFKSIYFWANYNVNDDFIVVHSNSNKFLDSSLYFISLSGELGTSYRNILNYMQPNIKSGCIGDLDVSYISFKNEDKRISFLLIDEQSYVVDVTSIIEQNLVMHKCK